MNELDNGYPVVILIKNWVMICNMIYDVYQSTKFKDFVPKFYKNSFFKCINSDLFN